MEYAKVLATEVLKEFGFRVEEIPVGSGRSADLRIEDESSSYHLEVKEKFESVDGANARRDCLNRGDLYQQADLLARDNRISGILKDARSQLDGTPKGSQTFQLIWFHASGIDADAKKDQAFATFYGKVDLIALYPRQGELKPCFYFDYSAAFSMPTVEALILSYDDTIQMCLNEYAIRGDEFRKTRLYREFYSHNGVVDPIELADTGKMIPCRTTIARRNDNDIANELKAQTGVLYTPIRLTRHAVSAVVQPRPF